MAITLDELRRQVKAEESVNTQKTSPKMTLEELRKTVGTTAPQTAGEVSPAVPVYTQPAFTEPAVPKKTVQQIYWENMHSGIEETDSMADRADKLKSVIPEQKKKTGLPDVLNYQGIYNRQKAKEAAERIAKPAGNVLGGAMGAVNFAGELIDTAALNTVGGIATGIQAGAQSISGQRGQAMKRLLDEGRNAQLGADAGMNNKRLVDDLQRARKEEKLDKDAFGVQLLDEANKKATNLMKDMNPTEQFLTQTMMSVLENAYLMPLGLINPAAAGAALAASATGRSTYDATKEGKSLSEAFTRGVIDGSIEMATEKIGVDTWLDILTGKGGGLIKNLAKQAGSEGIEEGMSYFAGWLMDVAQNDPDAKFSAQELLTSAAGGALSGLILGGGTAAMVGKDNYIRMRNDETSRQAEQAEQQAGTIDDIAIPVQDEQQEEMVMPLITQPTTENTPVEGERNTHTAEQLQIIKEYEDSTDSSMLDFIDKAENWREPQKLNKVIGTVKDSEADVIKRITGIDVSGFKRNVKGDRIVHIIERHGVSGKADKSMANPEDIARMQYVMDNPDEIVQVIDEQGNQSYSKHFSDSDNKKAPLIAYAKAINGVYYIVEAVPDSDKKILQLESARILDKSVYHALNGVKYLPADVRNEHGPYHTLSISHPTQDMQDADTSQVKNGKLVPEKWRREQPAKENNIQDKAQQVIVKAKSKAQKQLLRKKLTDSGKADVVKQLEAFEKRTGINVWFYNGELEDMGGFAYKGEMFLDISDPDILLTTAIHESIHLYKNNNIDKFNKLRDRIFRLEEDQKSEYGEIGFWTRDAYTEIYGNDTDAINEEVVAKLCEICVNNPEQFFDTLGKEKTIIEIIADILREIKNTITIKLTNSEQAKIDNTLIALERYLRGDAGVSESTRFSKKHGEEHKAQQFNLLQNTNPMHDDYHTGIRSTDDIYTAEEVFTEDEFMGTPDWTLRDAETALNNGMVTVYSSYPISDGVFVTPSRMIAQDYAGNGRVFSKNVPLESVAWIDSDEGQYAPVNNGIRFSKNTLKNRHIIEKSEKTSYTNSRWVKDNSIVSDREYEDFISKVMSIKTGTHFEKASNGLYIIPTGDEFGINSTLIFTDGNSNNPSIEKVVHINLDNETAIEKVRDYIYEKEIGKWKYASRVVGNIFPKGVFSEYRAEDFRNFHSSAGRRQRSARGKDTGNNRQQQNRAGNSGQSEKTLAGYISESIEDYAEDKNAYFVTLADGRRRRFNRYENKTGLHIRINGRDYSSLKDMVKTENAKIMGASDGAPFKLSRKIERKAIPEEYQGMSSQEITKALIEKHGAHKKGEKITNEVSVPKKDMQGRNVAKGSQTIMEASATKESMLDDYQKAIAAGAFSYDVNRDKDAVDKAVKYIEDNGFRNTLDYWKSKISNDEALTKDDMAKAQIMYAVAVANDDYDTAMELAVDISIRATKAGQVVQAMRLLKKTTPEGRLYFAQKSAKAIQKEIDETYGKKAPKLKIPKEINEAIRNADTQEKMDEAVQKMHQCIVEQLPFRWSSFITSYRYLAMLGNTRTQVRNVLSNVMGIVAQEYTNFVQTGVETGVNAYRKAKGKEQIEKTSTVRKPTKQQLELAAKDYRTVRESLSGKGKYKNDSLSALQSLKNPFEITGTWGKNGDEYVGLKGIARATGDVAMKGLTAWNTATNWAMDKGDQIFSEKAYKRFFARYLAANNINPDKITDSQLFKARNWATKQALESVYRENNEIANALSRLEKKWSKSDNLVAKAGGVALGGLMPFKSTPMNITKRAFEYTPAGIAIEAAQQMYDNHKHGVGYNIPAIIDKASKSLSGSSLILLGAYLAKIGLLTGGLGDDKEDKMKKQMGQQSYAINVGDYSYTMEWAGAGMMPLFVGADIYSSNSENEDWLMNIGNALANAGSPIIETSMMTGFMDALQSMAYEDNAIKKVATAISSALANYLGQFVPTILGQAARTIDDTSRTSYTNVKGVFKPIVKTAEKAQNKIPFLSRANVPYMDVWGNEEKNTGGNVIGRLLYNTLSPGYATKKSTDKVEKMLMELYDKTGETSVLPSNYTTYKRVGDTTFRFTDKQFENYTKTYGQAAYDILEDLSRDKGFKSMKDAYKAEVIEKAYRYSTAIASNEVVDKALEVRQKNQKKALEKGVSAYYVFGGLIEADGMGSEGNANGSLSKSEVMAYIESRGGLSKTEKAYLFAALGNSNWKNPYA